MTELSSKRCAACEGGVSPLSKESVKKLLIQVPTWQVNEEATMLHRHFKFKNFYHTMAFVNAVAWIAHQENHHPDMEIGYDHCALKYTTHAINGLSENDFICAAKVDAVNG